MITSYLIYIILGIIFFTIGYCVGSISYSKEVETLEDLSREADSKTNKNRIILSVLVISESKLKFLDPLYFFL